MLEVVAEAVFFAFAFTPVVIAHERRTMAAMENNLLRMVALLSLVTVEGIFPYDILQPAVGQITALPDGSMLQSGTHIAKEKRSKEVGLVYCKLLVV